MRQLAKDIDAFLNEVILQAENQHEILIGHCTSEVALTNTQEHILMLFIRRIFNKFRIGPSSQCQSGGSYQGH